MSRLDGLKGMRILEIGGADCRILRNFSSDKECWNAEKFEGKAGGPSKVISTPGVKNTPVFLGEFSELLPDAYFDIVLSVSVVEHVETPHLQAFFNDIARVPKPGGKTFHAIDVYLFDEDRLDDKWAAHTKNRLERYIEVETFTEGKLQAATRPDITTDPVFRCSYASNADREMFKWNKYAPSLAAIRSYTQSCSLKCEWVRV